MTTLTIYIPDDDTSIISKLTSISKEAGLSVSISNDEDDLSEAELNSLQAASEEIVLIKKGLQKPIPISELWNEE